MDANPDKCPTTKEIYKIIGGWYNIFHDDSMDDYSKEQQDEGESIRKKFDEIKFDPSMITATIHPNAIYTSRLLKFTSLPQPVNPNKVTIISNNNGNYH